ncbi:MAG TPA: phosphoenolpyruvate kinase, partial [Thermoanaerobaculia bacterium]|nr:phosphoenolpyruvate kinase [Thermoanaerobaculia bacterium]
MKAATVLSSKARAALAAGLETSHVAFARRYPGESPRRQPVHTVYGGAPVFESDSARKLGAIALQSLEEYAPRAETLRRILDLPRHLAS